MEREVGRQNTARLEAVRELLVTRRMSVNQAARALDVTPRTVCHYARKLGIPRTPRRRYDWEAVQRFYDHGHSLADCRRHFGMANRTITEAVRRGDLISRPQAIPVEELLVAGRDRNRTHVKGRLIREGLKVNRCERCLISEWRGLPMSMQLHHINGIAHDNRLENLQLLCPNCHSQTENHSRKQHRAIRSDATR